MGRRAYSDLEKLQAKKISNERNKKWQLENKSQYNDYLRSYYQLNKSRLNAQRTANRRKLRERQLESAEIVADIGAGNVVN